MAARDSLDEIRDEDDSRSDSDLSDRQIYGGGEVPSRWSRARPRPATRTLAAADDDDFADLIEGGPGLIGVESVEAGDSLGSSSESELRVTSARPSAAPGRASALSDNEF